MEEFSLQLNVLQTISSHRILPTLYAMADFIIWKNLSGSFLLPFDLDLMARTRCLWFDYYVYNYIY